jgi:precorrin-2/cobalt-factor-2 C20-methyltransferase
MEPDAMSADMMTETGTRTGTLWGVGVGPGDPELMTLKADRLIRAARVVAYPAPDTGESFARAIAAHAIAAGAEEIPMIVPMRVDRFPAQEVYAASAERIARHLEAGEDVVVLCEGDPFFYGSFMYLFARLAERFAVEVVPGVSSLGACAAALKRPLTARNDVLTVIPGPLPDEALRARIEAAEAIAIMKVGRHLGRIRTLLDTMGLGSRAGYVERASLDAQSVRPLAEAPDPAPYFSMILIYKGDDPWLT